MLEFQQQPRGDQPGPLDSKRFEIVAMLEELHVQNGDCLYRASNAKGFMGLPFSRLVARATKSEYSHAATVVWHNDELGVLEINDMGTQLVRMVDWISTCYTDRFAVARLHSQTELEKHSMEFGITSIIREDPNYDFTFSDPHLFYCTEGASTIVNTARPGAFVPVLLKDAVEPWVYWACRIGSPLFKYFANQSLPFDTPVYFVGNKSKGMMASKEVPVIYEHGVAA